MRFGSLQTTERQTPVEVETQMYHRLFFITIFQDVYHSFSNFEFKEDWVVGEEKDDPRRKAGKQTNGYFKLYREHVLKYPHIT